MIYIAGQRGCTYLARPALHSNSIIMKKGNIQKIANRERIMCSYYTLVGMVEEHLIA